jgi:hypothetical protein
VAWGHASGDTTTGPQISNLKNPLLEKNPALFMKRLKEWSGSLMTHSAMEDLR